MIENYDRALGHPNEGDVERVKREVRRVRMDGGRNDFFGGGNWLVWIDFD